MSLHCYQLLAGLSVSLIRTNVPSLMLPVRIIQKASELQMQLEEEMARCLSELEQANSQVQ